MTSRPQQPLPEQTENRVRDVIRALEDGRTGFAKASERLEEDGNPDLAAKMMEFAEQRQRLADELKSAASGYLQISDDEGTTGGKLHRAWMSLADAMTGDDPHAVLAVAEQGEDHAKKVYQDVLQEGLPDTLEQVLRRQSMEVIEAHDEVRDLRDQYAD